MLHNIVSWVKGNRRSLMGLGLLAIGLVVFMALGPDSARGAGTNDLAKLWINDLFPSAALFSDGQRERSYVDWRLSGGDPCVTAWVKPDGFFFIYMDYTGLTGHNCSSSLGVTLRTYRLMFPAPWGAETIAEKSPRIRIEKLFSKKKRTPVAFLFYRDGISYEVRTDQEVYCDILGNTSTLTYTGTARLWRITTPYGPVTSSFWFPFQLTVERVPE